MKEKILDVLEELLRNIKIDAYTVDIETSIQRVEKIIELMERVKK